MDETVLHIVTVGDDRRLGDMIQYSSCYYFTHPAELNEESGSDSRGQMRRGVVLQRDSSAGYAKK